MQKNGKKQNYKLRNNLLFIVYFYYIFQKSKYTSIESVRIIIIYQREYKRDIEFNVNLRI